jgi:hypothetical protein
MLNSNYSGVAGLRCAILKRRDFGVPCLGENGQILKPSAFVEELTPLLLFLTSLQGLSVEYPVTLCRDLRRQPQVVSNLLHTTAQT